MFKKISQPFKNKLADKQYGFSNLATLAIMLLIAFGVSQYQQRHMTQGQAPTVHGIDYSQGPTLVYFWASWCAVCQTTSNSVSTLAKKTKNDTISGQVISVALSSGRDNEITRYQQQQGYQFKTINDDQGLISQQWGVAVTPSFFIIDTQGNIHSTSTGITSPWGMKLRLWLAKN